MIYFLGNSKPATVVKTEGAGSLFEKVESEDDKVTKQQTTLNKPDENIGACDQDISQKPGDSDDKIVVSELEESAEEK